ncbi:hypothetical protein [Haloarchaeobius sp. HME9146]|uniref:hypothetical protein n=1 Tax=Haloarchaeobius sp. HME9146 TaxID=2978732 RepID=UPI0021C03240|nr:hypothetical protein [Haloarchaeobius sp. HME9146]MCT9095035.1 hypothetical protein [Haloarchaeobius sp. HME9146]
MPSRALKIAYGAFAILVLGYAIITRNILLGLLLATIPFGFYLTYLTLQLFRRFVVALERIADSVETNDTDRFRTDGSEREDHDEDREVSELFD